MCASEFLEFALVQLTSSMSFFFVGPFFVCFESMQHFDRFAGGIRPLGRKFSFLSEKISFDLCDMFG